MDSLWIGALLSGVGISLVAMIVGVYVGSDGGWAVALFGLAVLGAHHMRNLAKLARWLRSPPGNPVPQGRGAWDLIYADLHRRARAVQTERAALQSALERFTAATQAMPDGVVIIDPSKAIEWMNAAGARHFDLDARRDVGNIMTNLVRQPEFSAYLDTGNYDKPIVLHAPRFGGRVLSIQVFPFGAEQRLIMTRDVTQIERLETMRRDFVANVSHELKTPLTVIGGFIESMLDAQPGLDEADARRFLQLALEQSRRMERLVDDLLTLGRLEYGDAPASDAPIEVDVLIAEVAREAQALSAGRHPIEISSGPPTRLIGAYGELRSAFSNLASNAVRYTPPGGRISLRWQIEPDGGGVFAVEDAGIGIEPHHIARLTERFYRVDRGRSRESGGTGLGLAIVKHVLSRHDARLAVESEPGRGSCFIARFPPSRIATPQHSVDAMPRS